MNGVSYSWGDNGNLLDDGASTYSYDHANRLVGVTQGSDAYSFAYNGMGDRLLQMVNGDPTEYTLDINRGLTQVLADGDNAYLYGPNRIGEEQLLGWQYHHGDALGSVRQLTDVTAAVTATQTYEPYGSTLTSIGTASTNYTFTGEWTDGTGLVHLRARYYAPKDGRFLTLDPETGTVLVPITLNPWQYGRANPVLNTDPLGRCLDLDQDGFCDYPPESSHQASNDPKISTRGILPDGIDECIICGNCLGSIQSTQFIQTIRLIEELDDRGVTSYAILIQRIGDPWLESDGRLKDEVLIALIMMEFRDINRSEAAYAESKEAVSNQYHSPDGPVPYYPNRCQGSCDTMVEQIRWLTDIQLLRDEPMKAVGDGGWVSYLDEARQIRLSGYTIGVNRSWTWGN